MISFPNCKINLGLRVLRKRADGFHDLETCFYPLPFTDVLDVVAAKPPGSNENFTFNISGIPIQATTTENLCVKALNLLRKDFDQIRPVQIHLHKQIPAGAGLGGGSSNATSMLILLNQLFDLQLSSDQLFQYASKLGSDCPFFLHNKPCIATGTGNKFVPLNISLSNYKILLVYPGIHVDTSRAFQLVTPDDAGPSIHEILLTPVYKWKNVLKNDFEAPVSKMYRDIAAIRDKLYAEGALYASMSGSGSSVFGIFPADHVLKAKWRENYIVRELVGEF